MPLYQNWLMDWFQTPGFLGSSPSRGIFQAFIFLIWWYMKKEKVYITRDEGSNTIWVWRKPTRGVWSPTNIGDEDVNYQRLDRSLENTDSYMAKGFKLKFGINIRAKTKKCCHLPYNLLHNEDYKLNSNDPKRKQ